MAGGPRFNSRQGQRDFFSSPDWLWGPSSLLFNGYGRLFPRR